eukprot:TRINITY_DN2109_c0_g6_i1.p1 TRINITY_DN2109_c0_g6~~TRINITY_DN2109_c0_g6_i1.p1  ORF type:complete len:193 (-),score=57.89 TRINITY_DN2109_c0_g6_i1:112-690(-)
MKVAVVCLLIIGVALSQNYESCFDRLRNIAKGQVDRPAKITPSNALEYILRSENTINLIKTLGGPCTDLGNLFEKQKSEGIQKARSQFPKILQRLKEASTKIGPSINNEANAERRTDIVRRFVADLNEDIVRVARVFLTEVYFTFYNQTSSKECSSRVAKVRDERSSNNALALVEASVANFKFCIAQSRSQK